MVEFFVETFQYTVLRMGSGFPFWWGFAGFLPSDGRFIRGNHRIRGITGSDRKGQISIADLNPRYIWNRKGKVYG